MNLSEELLNTRAAKGLSRRAAALVIGCHYMTLESWEKGHRDPGVEWAAQIATFIGKPEREVKEEIMRLNGWLLPDEAIVTAPTPTKPKRSSTKTTTGSTRKAPAKESLRRRYQFTPEGGWAAA